MTIKDRKSSRLPAAKDALWLCTNIREPVNVAHVACVALINKKSTKTGLPRGIGEVSNRGDGGECLTLPPGGSIHHCEFSPLRKPYIRCAARTAGESRVSA